MLDNRLATFLSKYGHASILIGIVLFFILSLTPSGPLWVVIKIVLFLTLLSLAYLHFSVNPPSNHKQEYPDGWPEVTEEEQVWLNLDNDQDIELLFEQFLEKSLQLIKRIFVSDTAVLLLANYPGKVFQLRYRISDYEDKFIHQNTFDILKGLPSLVLRNRTPLIENNLPQGQDILPYYKSGKNPAKSFAGVPVYYNNLVIGLICTDSKIEEAYSSEDLEILKQFADIISAQFISSNRLYEYETENWVANTLFNVSQEINQIQTVNNLWEYLTKGIPEIIPCDRISIAHKISEEKGEIDSISGGVGNLKAGKGFNLSEGVVGWVLRKNKPLLVEDFSSKDNYVPRFSANETAATQYYSLLAVPITNRNRILGAVCLESLRPRNFNEQHKRLLQTISNQAANVLITTKTLEHLKKYSYIDQQTKIENLNAFKFILPKEVLRAGQFKLNLSVFFVKLYFQLQDDDPNLSNLAVNEFLTLVLPNLNDTDYIFSNTKDSFIVVRNVGVSEEAKQFANTLIQQVKDKKVWANGRVYDFYINVGVINDGTVLSDIDKLLRAGEEVVKQARLAGPNTVRIFGKSDNQDITSATHSNPGKV